jgi:hypothetical protein
MLKVRSVAVSGSASGTTPEKSKSNPGRIGEAGRPISVSLCHLASWRGGAVVTPFNSTQPSAPPRRGRHRRPGSAVSSFRTTLLRGRALVYPRGLEPISRSFPTFHPLKCEGRTVLDSDSAPQLKRSNFHEYLYTFNLAGGTERQPAAASVPMFRLFPSQAAGDRGGMG